MALCAEKTFNSHLLPWSPGAGDPTGTFHPRELPLLWPTAPPAVPLGRGLGFLAKGTLCQKSKETRALGAFFGTLPREATIQDSALLAQAKLARRGKVLPPCGYFLELQVP